MFVDNIDGSDRLVSSHKLSSLNISLNLSSMLSNYSGRRLFRNEHQDL